MGLRLGHRSARLHRWPSREETVTGMEHRGRVGMKAHGVGVWEGAGRTGWAERVPGDGGT